MRRTVHHVAITVSDLEESLEFYENLLHTKVLYQMERSGEGIERITGVPGAKIKVAMLEAPNVEVELLEYTVPAGRPYDRANNDIGSMHFCLEVENVEEVYADLCKRGVRFNSPPVRVTEGPTKGWRVAYCLDPDGVSVEVCELPPRGNFPAPQETT